MAYRRQELMKKGTDHLAVKDLIARCNRLVLRNGEALYEVPTTQPTIR